VNYEEDSNDKGTGHTFKLDVFGTGAVKSSRTRC